MQRFMLKSKVHMATVTQSELEYEGSITIDEAILEKAGILPYEQVTVSNVNNGERFETYAIRGRRGSGEICLNGPTARKGTKGDRIIVFSYGLFDEIELESHHPTIVFLGDGNVIRKVLP